MPLGAHSRDLDSTDLNTRLQDFPNKISKITKINRDASWGDPGADMQESETLDGNRMAVKNLQDSLMAIQVETHTLRCLVANLARDKSQMEALIECPIESIDMERYDKEQFCIPKKSHRPQRFEILTDHIATQLVVLGL
jgi:hypothetical protein